MQILSLIYNFILICLAAWWLSDLSRHADLHTFEVWCTLFIIILHAVIILKILNPSILASIKRSTALGLNVLTVGYWVGYLFLTWLACGHIVKKKLGFRICTPRDRIIRLCFWQVV